MQPDQLFNGAGDHGLVVCPPDRLSGVPVVIDFSNTDDPIFNHHTVIPPTDFWQVHSAKLTFGQSVRLVNEANIEYAAQGLEALLNKGRAAFDAALALIERGTARPIKIFGYYHENIGNDDYPYLMVREVSEGLAWYGLPSIMEDSFEFEIMGFVQHDDPFIRSVLRRKLAGAVKQFVNRHHAEGIILADGTEVEFNAPSPPIYRISYTAVNSNPLVGGFVASFGAECYPSVQGFG